MSDIRCATCGGGEYTYDCKCPPGQPSRWDPFKPNPSDPRFLWSPSETERIVGMIQFQGAVMIATEQAVYRMVVDESGEPTVSKLEVTP